MLSRMWKGRVNIRVLAEEPLRRCNGTGSLTPVRRLDLSVPLRLVSCPVTFGGGCHGRYRLRGADDPQTGSAHCGASRLGELSHGRRTYAYPVLCHSGTSGC